MVGWPSVREEIFNRWIDNIDENETKRIDRYYSVSIRRSIADCAHLWVWAWSFIMVLSGLLHLIINVQLFTVNENVPVMLLILKNRCFVLSSASIRTELPETNTAATAVPNRQVNNFGFNFSNCICRQRCQ
jgi:hypothetical protein